MHLYKSKTLLRGKESFNEVNDEVCRNGMRNAVL